jgi:hypothetical protein
MPGARRLQGAVAVIASMAAVISVPEGSKMTVERQSPSCTGEAAEVGVGRRLTRGLEWDGIRSATLTRDGTRWL